MKTLIDSGCEVTLIGERAVKLCDLTCEPERMSLVTMGDKIVHSSGAVILTSVVSDEGVQVGPVRASVMHSLPLNVDLVLGLDVILKCGLTIESSCKGGNVHLGCIAALLHILAPKRN